MSGQLKHEVAAYLVLRRSVGFKLEGAERVLLSFADYAASQGTEVITTRLALEWACGSSTPRQASARLCVLRGFAKYLQVLHPASEVPPSRLVPRPRHRPTPYIYSEAEVAALMAAARRLGPGLWPITCEVAIGLMAATGMRAGEVLRLERAQVSFDAGMLTVLSSKFAKSRHVPLSASTLAALRHYDGLRAANFPVAATFFVSATGCRPNYLGLHLAFVALLSAAGIPSRPVARRPRMQDLRHSFAVRTVIGWYRAGEDVQALLPRLSTYLGHTDPASTYWYLSAAPELLALAAERLELPAAVVL